ncbi:MAG: sulfurtransferase complex subunit TusD [Parahaliea sp.]
MHYSLLVLAPPGPTSYTALHFARAVCAGGHRLERVFFLDAGVANGLATAVPPQGERDLTALWRELAGEHGVELVLCISSAIRRGLLDATEARRHERSAVTVDPAFTLGGLGLLVEATLNTDRLLTFGGPG